MQRSALRLSVLCFTATVVVACGGTKTTRDGPGSSRPHTLPGDAVPRQEPRSRYGNGPNYEVFGKKYTVMASSAGYQERGVASWYGKKFHGNLTSNREVYDMYGMTAAHKSLPLPTYVRVRNLRNNKSIVVRVNDRGPFVSNRIIDLSYAAAIKLDMVQDGTSLVEVTAINFDAPTQASQGVTPPPATPPPLPERRVLRSIPSVTEELPADNEAQIYVQVGAFGDRTNASRRVAELERAGIADSFIHEEANSTASLYRVRIGPVADVPAYDAVVVQLREIGINDPYLISE